MSRSSSLRNLRLVLFILMVATVLINVPGAWSQKPAEREQTHPRISALVAQTAERLKQPQTAAIDSAMDVRVSSAGEIGVEVRIEGPTADAAAALSALGVRVGAWSPAFPLIAAWVRPAQLSSLAALPMVIQVGPMLRPLQRAGAITTAGDTVLRTAEARAAFGLTGKGIRIGVISDGVGELTSAQASGELPATCASPLAAASPACVLIDPDNPGSGNEGIAMMEIIHDLSPGAILGFSSGTENGVPGFVAAIDFLQNNFKADVIVDDIGYLTEPYFEDGIIGTRAQQAVNAGVVFISAAGNDAQFHYQAPLAIPSDCPNGTARQCLHRFTPEDTTLSFTLPPGGSLLAIVQWNNPFNNTRETAQQLDDLDLYLLTGDQLLTQSNDDQRLSREPIEGLRYTNITTTSQRVDLVIDAFALRSGTAPVIEMLFSGSAAPEYSTVADSVYGHPAAAGVVAVGAVPAANPTQIQPYSSQGPSTISHPNAEVRQKPEIVATDCVATSVPNFSPFCGTSAAAPHVAALAALLLESEPFSRPARIRDLLAGTAVDLGAPAFDTVFGAGRVDAVLAVQNSVSTRRPPTLYLPLVAR